MNVFSPPTFCWVCWLVLLGSSQVWAQPGLQPLSLTSLAGFESPEAAWRLSGEPVLTADFTRLQATDGSGVLLAAQAAGAQTRLQPTFKHGDLDLTFEVLLPRDGALDLFLMGRYGLSLRPQGQTGRPTTATSGTVMGNRAAPGYVPRMDAASAAGLWQQVSLSFQAPRYATNGRQTEPARLLRLTLNGQVVQENVAMPAADTQSPMIGAVRTAPWVWEATGPVAIRALRYQTYAPETAALSDLQYTVYAGTFSGLPQFDTLEVLRQAPSPVLSQEVAEESDGFLLRFHGKLEVPRSGTYTLKLSAQGGINTYLRLGEDELMPWGWGTQQAEVPLEKGSLPFTLLYGKDSPWYRDGLGLTLSGPQLREQPLHALSSMPVADPVAPIYAEVEARLQILRCFIDYQDEGEAKTRRIVHAINVGFPERLAYTFDPERASLVQVWQGHFLDATPMWHTRGDGSSRPRGRVLKLGDATDWAPTEVKAWPEALPEGLGYEFGGYTMDAAGVPTFYYQLQGRRVFDHLAVDGTGLRRSLRVAQPFDEPLWLRVASGQRIEGLDEQTYRVDGRYYVHLDAGLQASVRTQDSQQWLVLTVDGQQPLSYGLSW